MIWVTCLSTGLHGICSNHQQITESITILARLELLTEMPDYYMIYIQLSQHDCQIEDSSKRSKKPPKVAFLPLLLNKTILSAIGYLLLGIWQSSTATGTGIPPPWLPQHRRGAVRYRWGKRYFMALTPRVRNNHESLWAQQSWISLN